MLTLDSGLTPLASLLASLLATTTIGLAPSPAAEPPGRPSDLAGAVAAAGSSSGSGSAAAADVTDVAATAPWEPPLRGLLLVLEPFDPPASDWLPGHRGVDLAAPPGATVRAAGAGIVVFAGPVAGRGVVSLLHEDGRRTTYEPVEATVVPGQRVRAGDPIGVVRPGAGHCGANPSCLHWGLLDGETYLDPLSLLGAGRPTLLPLPWP